MKCSRPMALLAVVLLGTACGSSTESEYKPVIAEVDGEIQALSEEEAKAVCENHYCEENHIYTAYFGRKKVENPNPAPAPLPVATPTQAPVPEPVAGPEKLDYSRGLMNLQKAWFLTEGAPLTDGSPEVVVAVVDTGVEISHPDLKNNIWVNVRERNGKPGVDDDGNGYIDDVNGWDFANNKPNGIDDNGHGTHCAGIIAAEKNGVGTRGVAPRVKIMALKFLAASGSGDTKNAIAAIRYAIKMGANVISNSWGGGGYSQLLDQAIQDARAKGIYVLAAAGNDSNDNDASQSYPAGISGVISVASSTSSDAISSFSNFGKKAVTIVAPGSTIYSTYLKGTYKNLSGTSMATPQVAGAIALALSLRRDLRPANVLDILCSTSVKILLPYAQCGRMDVGSFITNVSTVFP
jgi:subtilisin family serine protease